MSSDPSPTSNDSSPTVPSSTIIRWLVRETIGVAMVGVVLFLAAGTTNWPMGWALVGVTLVWVCANAAVLISSSPELIAERLGPRKGAKAWDTIIMSAVGLVIIGRLVVAGLDMRYGWSTGITLPLQLAALTVAVLGYAFGVWAMAVNAYFSQIVRIQEERGHTVVTDGPYRFVRHPGYVGTILFELTVPVMLGSWWALAVGGLIALLMVIRTALEDRTLLAELEGYPEYAGKVRYRLLPAVW